MSLLGLQSILARLYTDSAFRAVVFRDPSDDGTGLSDEEQQLLAALDRGQVERFARSLQQKRLGLVRELLPAATRLIGGQLDRCFFAYCDRYPSAPERWAEAIAFIDDLMGELPLYDSDRHLPGYWCDLLTCERLHLELRAATIRAADPLLPPSSAPTLATEDQLNARPQLTGQVRVAAFQYNMAALYPTVVRGEVTEAQPDPSFILMVAMPSETRVRMKRINAPSAQLLTLCDGTRKLEAILDEVAAGLHLAPSDRPVFERECRRFLTPLAENGLVRL